VGGARKNSKKRKTEAPLNFYVGVLTAAQDRAFGTTSSMQAAEPGKLPRWLMFADPVVSRRHRGMTAVVSYLAARKLAANSIR
jgi:hypothetical protein